MNDERIRLILDLGASGANVKEVKAALDAMGESAESAGRAAGKLEEGTGKAAKGTANLGRTMLETGRITQDFAQGGLAGILNNVEGFVSAVGLGSGVAGAITAVGVAAYVATPLVKSLWKSMTDGPESIPVEPLERMNVALAESKGRLDKLKESWGGSTKEAAEYNKALAETAKLEKEVTGERERRSALDKARKAEADAANPSSPEAAKVAQEVIAGMGGIDDAVNATRNALAGEDPKLKALREQAADLAKRSAQRRRDDPNNLSGQGFFEADQQIVQGQIDAAMKRLDARAVEIATGAREGNRGAIGDIARLLPGAGFAAAEPAGLAAAAEREAAVKREDDRLAAEAEAKAKRDKDRAAADAKEAADEAKAQAIFDKGQQDAASALAKMEQDRRDMDARAAKDAEKAAPKGAEARDKADLRGLASREFGANLSDSQTEDVLKRAVGLMDQGATAPAAARQAIAEMVQTMQAMAGEIAAMNQFWGQVGNEARQTRTRMGRGR